MMKIALITGASSGLGREFARQIPKLYQNLDEIWVVARRAERLNELEMELKVPVRIFDGDLNQDYIYKKLGIALGKSHANVRMLVNAAGYGKIGTFCEYGWKEETGMVDLNCRSLTKNDSTFASVYALWQQNCEPFHQLQHLDHSLDLQCMQRQNLTFTACPWHLAENLKEAVFM